MLFCYVLMCIYMLIFILVYVCCFYKTFFVGEMVAAGLNLLSEMDSTSALFKRLRLTNYLITQLYSSSFLKSII